MRKIWLVLFALVCLTIPVSVGCGPSYQSEDSAQDLVQQEDAEADIEAELAAEAADEE